ncbi:MAG: vitamin B12-dependent ribonucleotide reductase [Acidobacteria bacterium]|nr:vitamin B12-dependent ribonucleotide reductase [Acidobacteriota bacterium]MBV9068092.1 vitamin B12-dependent ribonucleotide reductase [Acidobacteriota bacterium]MBV9185399.1 vitamin B12-dependent ribonucleotide reductase [Acidobacteriota bacterium]
MTSIEIPSSSIRPRSNSKPVKKKETKPGGIAIDRFFTKAGVDVYDTCEWEMRAAAITSESGGIVFEQKDVEMPKFWSQMATNVVVSKYFRGHLDSPDRETSVRQLIGRVVRTITGWGREGGYFASEADGDTFRDELTHILLYQMAAFNSPVWFNVGIEPHPQCSACFINSVNDTMDSILGLAKTEGMLFKYGSGTGSNLSSIRSSKELLAGGGTASGPVSFMKGYDSFAGVIKSGGKTRRAAKMVILNADHPDIVDFIESKEKEEKKAWALIDAGYDGAFNAPGGAYDSVQFQNANHSVRVTDDFMHAYEKDLDWQTWSVTEPKEVMGTYKARELMRKMAESAHLCGDPGMQFDTTVNDWHPCPNTARINASNPCSEYMFLDDSACNLASLNLMRFYNENTGFDVEAYRAALRIIITAQEITVDYASYPTKAIEKNSHAFRPLGIGYANLGALLMARGIAYDSEDGRDYAAAITSILSGESYAQSARIASKVGAFDGYSINREPFLRVIDKHRRAAYRINTRPLPADLADAAAKVWDEAYALGQEHGYRNAQISVLAPTGTIAFMMDCDTTGIEPDIALVKYKKLVGGGMLKIVNQTVPTALKRLGYDAKQINEIIQYIDENDTIEGAPHIVDSHLTVFDCAFKAQNGTRSIHYMGHLKMMGAVQPFISGAISKTINMPSAATIEEIELAYHEAWKLGLKAVAVYRDGCKRSQPLSTGKDKEKLTDLGVTPTAVRRKLPDERESITHKFSISGHEGYITVGKYEDGTPGEIFITMAKEGSTISGLMDSFATMTSLALQHGVPLNFLVDKFTHTRFEPSGFTKNPEIPMTKSIMDYIFKWLATKFLDRESQSQAGVILREDAAPAVSKPVPNVAPLTKEDASFVTSLATSPIIAAPKDADGPNTRNTATFRYQQDAPSCSDCGSIMVRNGACYKCLNCGSTSGCS